MIQLAIPVISSLLGLFRGNKHSLAKKAGVSIDIIDRVTNSLEEYLTKDEKALRATMESIEKARQYDIATFDKSDLFSNRLRSSVRPLCTFAAMSWYVYARLNNILLSSEDYAIIGGILAFWFGFRPFDKRK